MLSIRLDGFLIDDSFSNHIEVSVVITLMVIMVVKK